MRLSVFSILCSTLCFSIPTLAAEAPTALHDPTVVSRATPEQMQICEDVRAGRTNRDVALTDLKNHLLVIVQQMQQNDARVAVVQKQFGNLAIPMEQIQPQVHDIVTNYIQAQAEAAAVREVLSCVMAEK